MSRRWLVACSLRVFWQFFLSCPVEDTGDVCGAPLRGGLVFLGDGAGGLAVLEFLPDYGFVIGERAHFYNHQIIYQTK
jgi:hypothetical protein